MVKYVTPLQVPVVEVVNRTLLDDCITDTDDESVFFKIVLVTSELLSTAVAFDPPHDNDEVEEAVGTGNETSTVVLLESAGILCRSRLFFVLFRRGGSLLTLDIVSLLLCGAGCTTEFGIVLKTKSSDGALSGSTAEPGESNYHT